VSFSVDLEIFGKGLELLKEIVPRVRRVAVLSNPANPAQALTIKDVKAAGRSLGVQLQLLEARGPNEFDGAFAAMAKERAEALLVVSDSMFLLHRARLADLAAKNQLPSMYGVREFVEAGCLMSYGPSIVAIYRRAAFFVDKILKGAKPADLPVEQPTKFELAINLKTAKALGLTIPQSLLQRADQVIE
jgi:putative ABC transport system substrate-binding protein